MRRFYRLPLLLLTALLLAGQVFALPDTDALLEGIDPEQGLDQSVVERIGAFDPEQSPDLPGTLRLLLLNAAKTALGDLRAGLVTAGVILAALLLTGLFSAGEGAAAARLCGVLAIGAAVGANLRSMIGLGLDTMKQILEYTGLLLPGLASLTAGAGFAGSASSLYLQASFFLQLLTRLSNGLLSPLIYVFLGLSAAEAASGHPGMSTLCDLVRSLAGSILKTTGYLFTGLQGLVSITAGAMDENKLKAARLAMSGAVPMVGGILSDAAGTLFTAAGWLRGAVGVYGMLAVAALCLAPFLRIALHHGILRLVHGLSGAVGASEQVLFLRRCCQAMELVLAMVGTFCLLSFLSLVLFLRGQTP